MVNQVALGDCPEAFTGFEPVDGFLLLMVVELGFGPSLVPRLMAAMRPSLAEDACAPPPPGRTAPPLVAPHLDGLADPQAVPVDPEQKGSRMPWRPFFP
jgi:hypothetical protein